MLSSSSSPRDVEVVKWYTRARRFPKLIGKTHDGRTIWGGPYTYTQVVVFAVILVIASRTTEIWGRFDLVTNVAVLAGFAVGVVFLLGRLPVGSRNPLTVLAGVKRSLDAPSTGRFAGRPVRISGPHRVPSRLVVSAEPGLAPPGAAPLVVAPIEEEAVPVVDEPAPVASPPAVAALSGVQALLAAQKTTTGV